MFYLLQIEGQVIEKSTEWMEVAAKWGLGIVLAVLILIIFALVLFKILKNVDKDRDAYMKLLDKKDEIVTNHLSHIEGRMGDVDVTLGKLITSGDSNTGKIVKAIENQTELFKDRFKE